MKRVAVKIDSNMPSWAKNYLEANDVLSMLRWVKVTARKEVFEELLEAFGKKELISQIECNSKGHVVFKFKSERDKTFFMLKWA